MTRRPYGLRLGLLAIVGMLMMLVAPALPVAAQADPATEFNATISQLATMTPAAGPLSGSIDAANAQTAPAGVSIANGAAHAEFTVPAVTAGTLWAIAMEFRVSDAGKNFLLIFPDGTWQLDNGVQGGSVKGTGATFDTTAGSTVALDVVFNGASGSFGLNGAFVSALDLSAVQGPGDVDLTGYLGLGAGVTSLEYSNFSVYDLQGGAVAPTPTAGGVLNAPTEIATAAIPSAEATTGTTGDPAAIFAQYLTQETTQPIVFGPQSGVLIHDPERVTFLPTNVQVSDFGVHIECIAPRTAAELWDCGLAFRDTSSVNHYRLGVVSDGHWFLSVGAGDPLQQGEGVAIPAEAGGKIALDLIVVGNTGYFGVDGTFVSELDLSQIPGPGTVAAVIGFFNETYIANGQTAYEDFVVWNLDQGAAPASETAVVGVPTETPVIGLPTQAPTVAFPPAETPTTAAGIPTEAPTVAPPPVETPTTFAGLATETPIAGVSTDLPGVDTATNTYTSPSFGYQLSWDSTWSPVTSSSQDSFDVLRIAGDITTVDLYSGVSSMSLQDCITSLVEYYQGNASYTNVVQVPFADGQMILTQGNAAISTLTFDYNDGTTTIPTTDSVICVAMPAQGALVTMESYIPTADYATQIDAVRTLESQLIVDGAPVVLPVVPVSGGVPTIAAPTEAVPTTTVEETAVAVPTVASAGSASFVLTSVGSSVSGIGTIAGQARTVNVTAILIGAQPGSSVGIARGSCAELTTVLEPDYYVGDVTETGIVQGSVPVSLSVLQTRGPYSVVVYGPGDGAPMVACGEITVG